MPINTHIEHVVTLSQATHYRPLKRNGKCPVPRTLKRWAQDGVKTADQQRVFLETVRMPSGTCTSHEAIDRLLARIDGSNTGQSLTRLDRTHDEAERLLVEMGFAD